MFSGADLKNFLLTQWRQRRLLSLLALVLLSDLVVLTPVVYAQSQGSLSLTQSYAIGLLGVTTVGLGIYLFVVMLKPEWF